MPLFLANVLFSLSTRGESAQTISRTLPEQILPIISQYEKLVFSYQPNQRQAKDSPDAMIQLFHFVVLQCTIQELMNHIHHIDDQHTVEFIKIALI
jgi:hypothetical protein